jgi:hypothetical protein
MANLSLKQRELLNALKNGSELSRTKASRLYNAGSWLNGPGDRFVEVSSRNVTLLEKAGYLEYVYDNSDSDKWSYLLTEAGAAA